MAAPGDGITWTVRDAEWINPVRDAPAIVINGEDNRTPLVTIHRNGTLEYGPGYDPDEAARRFWDAMRHYMPARCERCGHMPGQQVD